MTYLWFKVFNLTSFNATGLVCRTYTLNLEGIGQRDFLVTKGEVVSMLYDGVFLTIDLNDKNPFAFDGHAVYLDSNNDVWLGIEE